MHISREELHKKLEDAAKKVTVGGLYAHYKNPELRYKVLRIAITEADDELCVIYEAQYGTRLVFARPLTSWLDQVEWSGKTTGRFTLVK